METARTAIPISEADLLVFREKAERSISRINGDQDIGAILMKCLPEDPYRLLPQELELIFAIRRGVCLYLWFANWLYDRTGQRDDADGSADSVPTERLRAKQKFNSNYALWVTANYIVEQCEVLLKGKDDAHLASVTPNYKYDPGKGFTRDLMLILSYYADTLNSENSDGLRTVKQSDDILSVSRDFWKTVSDKAAALFPQSDPNLQVIVQTATFKYNEFVIQGFKVEYQAQAKATVWWSPVKEADIVSNDESVLQLKRLAHRIALYDVDRKMNPMCEFGTVYESVLLDGAPGTGKTMLMKFFITLLSSLSEQVGLQCVVRSLEASQVKSEWFGRSGRLVKEMTEAVTDPLSLGVLIADDVDLMVSNRDEPGTGGADRDILKGLMDFFSGVGTAFRGNYTSIAATNKPTATDDALRQRFVYRTIVRGPQSCEDFVDMTFMQLRRPAKFDLLDVGRGKYAPMSRKKSARLGVELQGTHKGSTWEDIGHYIEEIRHDNPFFTARSVKNALDVVIAKASDFDIPENWLSDPSAFRTKPWDERIKMIRDLYTVKIDANMIMAALEEQRESEKRYELESYLKPRN
jgi:hypothetical protein